MRIDYTDCVRDAPKTEPGTLPEKYISAHFSDNSTLNPYQAQWQVLKRNVTYHNYSLEQNVCQIRFNIPENLQPTVNFYYYLENFYQNHRRYVGSFNAKQLLGDPVDASTLSSTCDPLARDPNRGDKIVYPCGIIANSMFNDTFSSPTLLTVPTTDGPPQNERLYSMANNTGIAWSGLGDLYGKTRYNLSQIVPPPNWNQSYMFGYTDVSPPPDLHTWEAFQNWMMLAASPNFYKLYQRNDRDVMDAGTYRIDIVSNFDTNLYNGRKSFVITTVSTMGSRNIWPGIIFLIVGGICLILDVYFILSFFLWKPRKLGDPSYLSWNQPQAPAPAGHATSAS